MNIVPARTEIKHTPKHQAVRRKHTPPSPRLLRSPTLSLHIEHAMAEQRFRSSPPRKDVLSIIVPTLWKDQHFPARALTLADCEITRELIIIDNNPIEHPLLTHPKIRLISQGKNIYVNPAWNLGVDSASGDYICLLNDDIGATQDLLRYGTTLLADDIYNKIGVIGLSWSEKRTALMCHQVRWRSNHHFGAALFMRKHDYSPIPEDMKIWWGDDYLIMRALGRRQNIIEISGLQPTEETSFSLSIRSNQEAFEKIIAQDTQRWFRKYRAHLLLRIILKRPQYFLLSLLLEAYSKARRAVRRVLFV